MGDIVLAGATSGTITLQPTAVAGSNTLTLPTVTATVDAFPSGTALLFNQTSAPTGWTKSTSNDNAALRVVSGSVGTGGSVNFTTAFASQTPSGTVGSTTLTSGQVPTINIYGYDGGANYPFYATGSGSGAGYFLRPGVEAPNANGTGNSIVFANGGGGSHNHSFTGNAINLAVKYVDCIVATKN